MDELRKSRGRSSTTVMGESAVGGVDVAFSISKRARTTSSSVGLISRSGFSAGAEAFGGNGSGSMRENGRTAQQVPQVTAVQAILGYAVRGRRFEPRFCRTRSWGLEVTREVATRDLSVDSGWICCWVRVSLFIRGGFRSHLQNAHRVAWV